MSDLGFARVRAGRVNSALQERIVGTRSAGTAFQWFVFFLDSGNAVAVSQNTELDMSGPALKWAPMEEDTRLRVSAGSSGYYVFLDQTVVDEAIGATSEAAALRIFSSQPLVASYSPTDALAPRLENLFERILHEAGSPAFGSESCVSAYIRLLLVLLWRSVEKEPRAPETMGFATSDVARFRSLVEAHFRARWTARKYAHELGISYDRLHDLCVRSVGKPPAVLIRERCLHEARVLLQRTSLSLDRISAMLGFSSASQFNHFFKSMAGESPGKYRKQLVHGQDEPSEPGPRFADWP